MGKMNTAFHLGAIGCFAAMAGSSIYGAVENHRTSAVIRERVTREHRDADQLLYLVRLGMIRLIAACAYAHGNEGRPVAEMRDNCSLKIGEQREEILK